LKFHSNI